MVTKPNFIVIRPGLCGWMMLHVNPILVLRSHDHVNKELALDCKISKLHVLHITVSDGGRIYVRVCVCHIRFICNIYIYYI